MNKRFAYTLRRESSKWAAALAIGLSASLCLSIGAEARDAHKQKSETISVYLFKDKAKNGARFNTPTSAKTIKVSATQYAGATTYVCTPSGFGQKSRCFNRD
ncbi:hypothetical protein CES85_2966 (plasmid) [Ochrobactrum quorumnocens]|uniref:Uncharacterized protein n=1 Tax=Ochrobactrum quorumnocens TaxID=271865 RepID=A0A248UM70_9HYPH|nr:hypothetical protein [[Ochrobactrum] quorumnocens]ASV87835.1 hypothetical protein CES85_2966 [[Ochrobactrum] quorumnocens]